MLRLDAVSKTYTGPQGCVYAVAGLTLHIQPGEFVAVRGPSGCGKTTLLLMAGALLRPDAGTVQVSEANPYAMPSEARARFRAAQIGFVFQQFHLVPYLSVLENVLAASLALPAEDAPQRAAELVERFGLRDRAHHVPAQLSTGERQRTAMARALLNRPKLLLADEPTGNLDAASGKMVLDAMAEFAAAGGAMLLVTHDDRAAGYAQKVIEMGGQS
ncbi:MAG: ABC transporter ATP-binding protein [Tepidisphaerales bacterium]